MIEKLRPCEDWIRRYSRSELCAEPPVMFEKINELIDTVNKLSSINQLNELCRISPIFREFMERENSNPISLEKVKEQVRKWKEKSTGKLEFKEFLEKEIKELEEVASSYNKPPCDFNTVREWLGMEKEKEEKIQEPELKNCPFCNLAPTIWKQDLCSEVRITCENMQCGVCVEIVCDELKEAIELWNTRHE